MTSYIPDAGSFGLGYACQTASSHPKNHRARMTERRARQLARTPGETPMPNRRISAMLARAVEDIAMREPKLEPHRVLERAKAQVVASLPPTPIRRRAIPLRPWPSAMQVAQRA